MPITITEALAGIKTVSKRIEKKREFILNYLARPDGIKDPLEKEGGSHEAIMREAQAVGDLESRIIALRRGIGLANDKTTVEVGGVSRSVTDWLTWRRDVAPKHKEFLARVSATVKQIRDTAKKQGFQTLTPGATATPISNSWPVTPCRPAWTTAPCSSPANPNWASTKPSSSWPTRKSANSATKSASTARRWCEGPPPPV